PQPSTGDPPVLAVDSGRLAAVSDWQPSFGQPAAQVATTLRAPATQPFVLRGDDFTVDLDRATPDDGLIDTNGDGIGDVAPPDTPRFEPLTLRFASLTDGSPVTSTVQAELGRHTYDAQTDGCAEGCRFTGFSASLNGTPTSFTVYGLRTA